MKSAAGTALLLLLLLLASGTRAQRRSPSPEPERERSSGGDIDLTFGAFRTPAVPLMVADPYSNIWCSGDNLTDVWSSYWPGTTKALTGLVRVDGTAWRWMGIPGEVLSAAQPLPQVGYASVRPLVTSYTFRGAGIELRVNFTTPALLRERDMDMLSRPVSFLDVDVRSSDGNRHAVQLYFDHTGEFAVDRTEEDVVWESVPDSDAESGLSMMRIGTSAQKYCGLAGDAVGINWGYQYSASPRTADLRTAMQSSVVARKTFVSTGAVPTTNDMRMPRPARDDWPVLAFSWNLGSVGASPVSRRVYLAYDEVFAIKWWGHLFRPLWRHTFPSGAAAMLQDTHQKYDDVIARCFAWDAELIANLTAVGGVEYATLASLAFRQATGGTKLVWNDKENRPWAFLKEISSDGDLSTVDVMFPASPLYLLYNSELMKLLLLPIFAYANNETSTPYSYKFAPHHLGFYPVGYILEKDQENMPMEESGNMLMMTTAVGVAQDNLDFISGPYFKLLETWIENITGALPDPGKQLCTDDFEGPTIHNANLAAKGIVALECFALILENTGNASGAARYRAAADKFAQDWIKLANPNNTDHYRLQYNLKGSWSQKYNLLFARLLPKMHAFPESVFKLESSYYRDFQLKKYGVPLDDRHTYSKIDWDNWWAAITDDELLFKEIVKRSLMFANDTPQRVPLSDWYDSETSAQKGFQARPVVGGLFAKLLRKQGISPT